MDNLTAKYCKVFSYSMLGIIASIKLAYASETPLCQLPLANNTTSSSCQNVINAASQIAKVTKSNITLINKSGIPSQLIVGSVYLQPINMAPSGMMLPANKSDIHLEIDIHAKTSLKSRGFAPGDWIPYVDATYSIQKIGAKTPLKCSAMHDPKNTTSCVLMPMVASDGPHYGDNVKLDGPGIYVVTFKAHTQPEIFGWHTDTDSKVLGTEFMKWSFEQKYIFKWTGIGKKGGY